MTSHTRRRSSQIIVTMSLLHTIDIGVEIVRGGGALKPKSKTFINVYLSYENRPSCIVTAKLFWS